jgi:hypothetical protein
MCLWYNSSLTLSLLDAHQWTFPVFSRLLALIDSGSLALDFELRRVILGLTQVVAADPAAVPALVAQQTPLIMQKAAFLALQRSEQRLQALKRQERKTQYRSHEEEEEESDSDFEDEETEGEFKEMQQRLLALIS